MLTRIRQDRSNVASFVPSASALEIGEFFVNINDRIVYSKDASLTIFPIKIQAVNAIYDNTVSGLASVDVQGAIDDLDDLVDQIIGTGVLSFNGRTGAVVPAADDYAIDELSDVDTVSTPPNSGDTLTYTGAQWEPQAVFNILSANAFIEVPQVKTYTMISDAVAALTVVKLVGRTSIGTVDVAVEIDGVPVTGASGTMSSVESTLTATAQNSISVGQRLTVVCSSLAAAQNLEFTISLQR